MKKAIIYLIEFIAIQLIVGFIVTLVWQLITKSEDKTTGMLITTTVATGVVTIVIFLLTRWAEVSPNWIRTRPWLVLIWSVIAAMGALIPSAWLQEQMPELPNFVENEFDMILTNRWGYLAIGLLAPLSEEIVLRGAVLRSLLSKPLFANRSERFNIWTAISISALFFALIHFNPAQMPHAFVIGLLLGWMYWRTGSILPGVAYHWANNSIAYIIYNIYPDPDMKLIDVFKGSELHVLMAVGFSMLILLPAIYQLHLWMRRAE
jgi:membrane protease YdiL (CAAX protease family)